jgi:hypothetical protein
MFAQGMEKQSHTGSSDICIVEYNLNRTRRDARPGGGIFILRFYKPSCEEMAEEILEGV